MDRAELRDLIEGSDLDGLVRFVDRLAGAGSWDEIHEVQARCNEAVERGKQVWGVVHYADYRLALEAPAPIAAAVVRDGAGRFAAGPLWEVAASTHTWEQLAPNLAPSRSRGLAAHERSIRGDAVRAGDAAGMSGEPVLSIPPEVQLWEPDYPVAVYRSDGVDHPEPSGPDLTWHELPVSAGEVVGDSGAGDALLDLVKPWIEESSGRAEVRCVEGSPVAAIRALGPRRVRLAPATLQEALAKMAWSAASGGAHGMRRGTAVGRHEAWYALAVLLGLEDDWPVEPDRLGAEAGELEWWWWEPGDHVSGWEFHLAVADPIDGLAWAISASDAR